MDGFRESGKTFGVSVLSKVCSVAPNADGCDARTLRFLVCRDF